MKKWLSLLLAAMIVLASLGSAALADDKTVITINTQASVGAEEAWNAVASAYMAKHPEVNVVVDLKPSENYSQWVQNMFATENPTADIVNINEAGAISAGKSINWLEYVYNDSPYSDGIWADQFNFSAQVLDLVRNEMTALSLDSVQVLWVYNKDIFAKVGVEPPATWDEFVAVCEKLDAAGYQPIAIAGDYDSFWAGAIGWLAQIYADQTTRSMINVFRAQEGDFCYDPDIDGVWSYDPTDPYNDDSWKVNQNAVRVYKAMVDGVYTADTAGLVLTCLETGVRETVLDCSIAVDVAYERSNVVATFDIGFAHYDLLNHSRTFGLTDDCNVGISRQVDVHETDVLDERT